MKGGCPPHLQAPNTWHLGYADARGDRVVAAADDVSPKEGEPAKLRHNSVYIMASFLAVSSIIRGKEDKRTSVTLEEHQVGLARDQYCGKENSS